MNDADESPVTIVPALVGVGLATIGVGYLIIMIGLKLGWWSAA